MHIKRIITLALCAALVFMLCPFIALAESAVLELGIYVGGLIVKPGENDFKYYKYSESPHKLDDEATISDYNIAVKYSGGRFTVIMNNLTVSKELLFFSHDEAYAHYACFCAKTSNPVDIILLGANKLKASDNNSCFVSCGIFSLGDVTISGAGKLTAQGGSNDNINFSVGLYCDEAALTISGGDLALSGGKAAATSYGVLAENGISMTGGKLTASAGSANDSVGIWYDRISSLELTGGELIAKAKNSAIRQGESGPINLGNNMWYEWRISATQTPYNKTAYSHSDAYTYIEIRPLLGASPISIDFGSKSEGYTIIESDKKTVELTNRTSRSVDVTAYSGSNFTIEPYSNNLKPSDKVGLVIKPNDNLPAGVYNDTLSFTAGTCTTTVQVRFTVTPVAPAINTHPSDQTVSAGGKATFSVEATGTATLSYQWQVSADNGANWSGVTDGSGGTTATYTTPDTTTGMNGYQYRCVVTNSVGNATSNPATLTVTSAPLITGETALTLTQGYAATTTNAYTVTGNPAPTVIKENGDATITWNATDNKLHIAAGLVVGIYPVTLKASNGIAPDATLAFTLTVKLPDAAPLITGETALTLTQGYAATTTNAYAVMGNPAPTVTIDSGNAAITWDDTDKKLHIAEGLGVGTYPVTLRASNSVLPDATLAFTLTVTSEPVATYKLTIANGSGGGTYAEGTLVQISASETLNDMSFAEWKIASGGGTLLSPTSASTIYIMPGNDASLTASYELIISSPIIVQPADQYVSPGQRATFSLTAQGEGLRYQWYVDRNDGRGWQALSGQTKASHTTTQTTLANDGYLYYCLITDASGATFNSNTAALHVSKSFAPPQTGDSSRPLIWMGICLLCGLGLALMVRRKRG